jgi:hypothetical protein
MDSGVAISIVVIFFWYGSQIGLCVLGSNYCLPLVYNIPKMEPLVPLPLVNGGVSRYSYPNE